MHLPRRLAQLPPGFAQGAALFLLAAAVFIPAMSGDYIWDDDITLTSNALVKLPFTEGLRNIWFSKLPTDYYPITWSTFWIEWRFFSTNAAGYHIVNILLHALSALLLWRVLLRLGLPGGAATAWCAALLFAAHPIAVDSVGWISQRKNTLAMVFYLASILSYLRFSDAGKPRFYWLSLFAFVAAFLSKASVTALPLILICLLWYRQGDPYLRSLVHGIIPFKATAWRRNSIFKHELVRLLPFFVLAAGSAYLTLWFQGKVLGYGIASNNEAAATVSKALEITLHGETGIGQRLLAVGQTYWIYIGKLLFPKDIAMVYGNWKINTGHVLHYLPSLLMIAAILGSFLLRKKIGRGPCAALAYIAFSLLPVLGLVKMSYQAYSWIANHLCYIAIPGAAVILVGGGAHLFARLRLRPPASKYVPLAAFVVVFLLFAGQSWKRSGFYQNPEELWRDNIAKIPQAHAPYNELGIVLIKAKRYEESIEPLEKCIAIDPTFDKPHNNLGTALSYLGLEEESIAAFERALHYNPRDPDAMGNLGLMYVRTNQPEKALRLFRRTLEIRPMSPSTYHNMGIALKDLKRNEEAAVAMERAVAMNPTGVGFRRALGIHYYDMREYAKALHHLLIALELGTDSLHVKNAAAWIMATNADPALRNGQRALQLITEANQASSRRDPGLLHTTAAVFANLGRFQEAIETLRELMAVLKEGEAPAADVGRIEKEISLYQQARPFRESKTSRSVEGPPEP